MYTAVISQSTEFTDPADIERTTPPIREVIDRGVHDQVLRADLRGDTLFQLFTAILERALWLSVGELVTPEEAAEAALAIFLDGARKPG